MSVRVAIITVSTSRAAGVGGDESGDRLEQFAVGIGGEVVAREVISDLITKGGFPNFLLPLVNFDALFAQAASEAGQSTLVN